jgi:hypothetical protein
VGDGASGGIGPVPVAWMSCSGSRWFSVCGGVKVGFRSLGADSLRVAGIFHRGDAGVGGGGELFQCVLVVGAETGGLIDGGGLGVLGPSDGDSLGLAVRACSRTSAGGGRRGR